MLISLKIMNYKSYKEISELSLISNSKIRSNKDHETSINKINVIKNCGIYGGNASGKSNLISAISFIKSLIINDRNMIYNFSFMGCENKPTTFIIIFSTANNEIFEYSFSIVKCKNMFNSYDVIEENLYKINYSTTELIYSYSHNDFTLNKELLKDKVFNTYIDGFKKLRNMLFLTYINENDKNINNNILKNYLNSTFAFFKDDINIISLDNNTFNFINTNNIETISKYLKEYDTGINDLSFVKCSTDEIHDIVLSDTLNKYIIEAQSKNINKFSIFNNKGIIQFDINDKDVVIKKLVCNHKNIKKSISYENESDGTKRIVYLISILLANNQDNKVYFIDEIERSIHPLLAVKLLKDFQAINKNKTSQIIFTTHQVAFMDEVLRRDEIYFCEKDNLGNSTLESLLEYESRSDSIISKKYLEGRFGAVPNLKVNINDSIRG